MRILCLGQTLQEVSYLRGRPVPPGEAAEFGPGSGLDPGGLQPAMGTDAPGTECWEGGGRRPGEGKPHWLILGLESLPRKIHLCHRILSTQVSLLKKYY